MGDKHARLSALLAKYQEAGRDPHYLAFFECFNRQLFFEAHEVLEELWLGTAGQNHSFYKGLIQLAGAFVHVQKGRKGPALALLRLARENLRKYPDPHEGLEVGAVLQFIATWSDRIRNHAAGRESELLLEERPALAVSPAPIRAESGLPNSPSSASD